MSRRAHTVVQSLLLVLWGVVLMADNARPVSSQSCNQPDYSYKNPLRNFWNPNIGNITVKIDQLFETQYPEVSDAVARIEAGNREWNNLDICASSINFIDFKTRSFTATEYSSPAPSGHVYWLVTEPNSGSYAGIISNWASNRTVSANVRVRPSPGFHLITLLPSITLVATKLDTHLILLTVQLYVHLLR